MQKLDMRTLIFGGSVIVLAMLAWVLYLEHDKRQFIENLPKLPPADLRQGSDLSQRAVPTRGEVTEQAKLEDVVEGITESSTESGDSPGSFVEGNIGTPEDPFSNLDALAPQDENQLAPGLAELFSKYRVLDEKRRAVVKVLEPMHEDHVLIINRHHEISHELSSEPDGETQQALNEERAVLLAREKELQLRIFKVQDEKSVFVEKLEYLVQEYGFASWKEFRESYQDDYKAWLAAQ